MLLVFVLSIIMTAAIIVFHYYSLLYISDFADKCDHHFLKSFSVVGMIFTIHIIEIVWYSAYIMVAYEYFGIQGFTKPFDGQWVDYLHLSSTSYTTLGAISTSPVKELAILIDFIALTGFMMLTWSATYYYNIFSNKED